MKGRRKRRKSIDGIVQCNVGFVDFDARHASNHRLEQRAHLQLSEVLADTHMDATAKAEMTARVACNVELVGPFEYQLVTIGRCEQDHDSRRRWQENAIDLDLARR